MKPRHARSTNIRALAVLCSPLSMSAAGAAVAPAPTLVRLDLTPFDRPTPFTEAINSCVALITAHDFAVATGACDGAVTAARRDHNEERARYTTASARAAHLAVAYNDRAVLHYVQGELALAAEDSARALGAENSPAIEATAAAVALAKQKRMAAD